MGYEDIQNKLFNIWDGAHTLELAVKDVMVKNENYKDMANCMKTVSSVAAFMNTGKSYAALYEVTDGDFRQPKNVKDMKFVGHSLDAFVNFSTEYTSTLQALEILTSDEKKRVEAEGYMTKITDPIFVLSLKLMQDLLVILTRFSKIFQQDNTTIQDYYNTAKKLVFVLDNISIKRVPDTVTLDALPNYFLRLNSEVPLMISSTRETRSSHNIQLEFSDSLLKKHDKMIRELKESVEARFSDMYTKQFEMQQSAAKLLNDLCDDFVDKEPDPTFCGYCGKLIRQREGVSQHHQNYHEGLPISTGKLNISTYCTEKGVDFSSLKDFYPGQVSQEQLELEYVQFKKSFKEAFLYVKKLKIVKYPTLIHCLKHMYCTKECFVNLPWNIKQLVLRLVTVQTSEAICESWGSVMERYHDRFTHSDLDDNQVQAEMFVNLCGPAYGECKPFLQKCLQRMGTKFVLNERAKYFSKGKTITKVIEKKSSFPFHKYI